MGRMVKVSTLLAALVALLALALPAMAGAAQLTKEGEPVEAGERITVTSTNYTWKVSAGTLACARVVLTGELVRNEEGTVEVEASGPSFAGVCTVGGKTISVNPTLDGLKFEGPPGNGTLGLVVDTVIAGVSCHYEYNSALVSYTPGTDSFNLSEASPSVAKPAATCAPGLASGDFAITDTFSGQPLILN